MSNNEDELSLKNDEIKSQPVPNTHLVNSVLWSGMVLAAATFGTTLAGISYSLFSLIYQDLIVTYECSTAMAGWIGSMHVGLGNVLSIFFGFLFERFGTRNVGMFSSIFCSIGYIIAYLSNSILLTALSLGILSGVSLSMMVIASLTVGFTCSGEMSRAFNGTILSLGFSIGALLGGVIVRFFPTHWPWKYVLIMYACINLHFVPVCALFFHTPPTPPTPDGGGEGGKGRGGMGGKCLKKSGGEELGEGCDDGLGVEGVDVVVNVGLGVEDGGDLKSALLIKSSEVLEEDIGSDENKHTNKHTNSPNDVLSNSSNNLSFSTHPPTNKSTHSSTHPPTNKSTHSSTTPSVHPLKSYAINLFSLLKQPQITCYFAATSLVHLSMTTFLQHGPRWMQTLGLSKLQSSYFPIVVATSSAIAKTTNTCFLIALSTRPIRMTHSMLHLCIFTIATLGAALSHLMAPICHDFVSVVTLAGVYSLFLGMFTSFLTTITLDLVGVDRLPQGQILLCLFFGSGVLISTPFAGYLYDTYNYTVTFVVTGVLFMIGSFLSLVTMGLLWRHNRNILKNRNGGVNNNKNNNNNNNNDMGNDDNRDGRDGVLLKAIEIEVA